MSAAARTRPVRVAAPARGAAETPRPPERAVLLAIRREHAYRIFDGTKRFELRKALPREPFARVYLYETGGAGVVGCFEAGEPVRAPLGDLWERVGTAGTTRARFDRYFAGLKTGCAIPVRDPVSFAAPLDLAALRALHPALTAPQSFVVLTPAHPLWVPLERARRAARRAAPPPVRLRPIAPRERPAYRRLVQQHIGPNYEGIDATFADANLRVHDLGHDPAGFFTTTKEVLAVTDAAGATLLGFTTLTHKGGGAVKSGPTILLPEHRGHGVGLATRRAITAHAAGLGMRKVYCTCPDTATDTIRYLLGAGLRVEAHLSRQYAADHGELVLGAFLVADEPSGKASPPLPERPGRVARAADLPRAALIARFRAMFGQTWYDVPEAYAATIVAQALETRRKGPAEKPKRLVCLAARGRPVAAVALLPKRGGSVKGLLLRRTDHAASLRALLEAASAEAAGLGGRKLYVPHPVEDAAGVRLLTGAGFFAEGLLRAPYAPGQDALVLSRFL